MCHGALTGCTVTRKHCSNSQQNLVTGPKSPATAWLEPQLCWGAISLPCQPREPSSSCISGTELSVPPQECHVEVAQEEEASGAQGSSQSRAWLHPADVIWPLATQQLGMTLKSSGSVVSMCCWNGSGRLGVLTHWELRGEGRKGMLGYPSRPGRGGTACPCSPAGTHTSPEPGMVFLCSWNPGTGHIQLESPSGSEVCVVCERWRGGSCTHRRRKNERKEYNPVLMWLSQNWG